MEGLADLGVQPVVITSDSNRLIEPPKLNRKVTREDRGGVTLFWLKILDMASKRNFAILSAISSKK